MRPDTTRMKKVRSMVMPFDENGRFGANNKLLASRIYIVEYA